MKRLKPWLVKLPLIVPIGWILYSALISEGLASTLVLILIFLGLGLGLYVCFWLTEKIFDWVTGSKPKRQSTNNTCSLSDFGNVDGYFDCDIPAGHHVAGLSHVPECDDVVSACVEGISSCFEGLHH